MTIANFLTKALPMHAALAQAAEGSARTAGPRVPAPKPRHTDTPTPLPLPCPFCASTNTSFQDIQMATVHWSVICLNCQATGPVAITKPLATHAWNTRP